jgi:O-antigen biosynthesis protein
MIQRIKQSLKFIWLILSDSRYRIIFGSGLFDKEYYLHTYPDVITSHLHPLIHYLDEGGALQGRKPNLFFDPSFYLQQYPEIKREGVLPLLHYIMRGWRENKHPSPLFCPEYYLEQISAPRDPMGNPLVHFLRKGITQRKQPSHYLTYFDPEYYLRNNPDVPRGFLNAYIHYMEIGAYQRRRPSLFFDSAWYQDKASVLMEMQMDLIQHYIEYGCNEGKSPVPLFDPVYYRENNPDIDEHEKDTFLHFLRIGIPEDRRPCPWFDPKFYRDKYADAGNSGLSPLEHYLQQGVYGGRYTEQKVSALPKKPIISIIVPVYNVEAHYLNNCIRSVLYQSYPHWELCLSDDSSTKTHVRPVLEKWAAMDQRIKVGYLPTNKGIVAASNAAATMAAGEYLGFLDNDDELAPECLYEIVREICEKDCDLLYTDEDLTGDDGRQFSIFRKPHYNIELSLSHNYMVHFMVTSRRLFEKVGGFSEGKDGSQDYDLFLKLSEYAKKITHIPKILYHWRASATSTSINHGQKEYADEAGRLALAGHLQRQGIVSEVQYTDLKFFYRVRRHVQGKPTVSVIVSYEKADDCLTWIRNFLAWTDYPIAELFILLDETESRLQIEEDEDLKAVVSWQYISKEQGIGSIYNKAADRCEGDYLIFFSSDITVTIRDWIEVLLEYASLPNSGMVGARIDDVESGGTPIGTLPDLTDLSPEYYAKFFCECSSHMNGLQCPQNVLAVSWNLCMIKKELFVLNTGFDDIMFPHLFGNIDLCLRLRERGFENIYTPYCTAERQATAKPYKKDSRRAEWAIEQDLFKKSWHHILKQGDPYYNLGLLEDNNMNKREFLAWYSGSG